MGYCPNCKAHLTCGCQRRVSKDGKAGCQNCIAQLNNSADTNKSQQVKNPTSGNAPTNVSVAYVGPGRKLDDL